MTGWTITDGRVFFGIAGAVVAYVLYMMIRRRKGERPGALHQEPEL
jgi:hypothetical protein